MIKTTVSGSASGSISQRHRSADPDPHQKSHESGTEPIAALCLTGVTKYLVSSLVKGEPVVVDAVGGIQWQVQAKLFTQKGRPPSLSLEHPPFLSCFHLVSL
jgi:hypothetical protein